MAAFAWDVHSEEGKDAVVRKPLVALVGRPNVGKSTLFNRLVGERLAIVHETPGTTRDRHYADVEWQGRVFTLIDTGGLMGDLPLDTITEQVQKQAQLAIEEADVIVFITDVLKGVTGADQRIANILRRAEKPIVPAVNKVDNLERGLDLYEFYALGLGEPVGVSALRGLNTGDLLDEIVAALSEVPLEGEVSTGVRVAVVGRTNVGKSSLLNQLLGQERVIVSEMPGTTRDAVDTSITYAGEEVTLIDTAGIRRRGRVERGIEQYSVLRALRAIGRADVVLLVIDALDGVTAQDAHIAGYIVDEFKSVAVLINKWDLVEKDAHTATLFEEHVRYRLKFMPYAPVLFVSALMGQRVDRVLPLAMHLYRERYVHLEDAEVSDMLQEAIARRSPPRGRGKRLVIYEGHQAGVAPPTFAFTVNDKRLVHFDYERYLKNRIRERYLFEGTPLRLTFSNRR
ncbi:MAG: ribosome biogenesis GTPase Der [Chloroflexota bacterium]|nr:ribosome biogenesis GTPase Der [Chloroflexota bacterium]